MKTNNIYVGINGATIAFSNGAAIAASPAMKGQDKSYFMMQNGRVSVLKGTRIGGVGVARFLKENGFELAKADDPVATAFADSLDSRDGTLMVERKTQERAAELQAAYGLKKCKFVPFDAEQPVREVEVEAPRGSTTMSVDMVTGFSSGTVITKYVPGSTYSNSIGFDSGWLVGLDEAPCNTPQVSEYGGIIEHAVYTICNAGFGKLYGPAHLAMNDDCAIDDPFPRGKLVVELENGDRLHVGSDAGDELRVELHRASQILYSRTGMSNPRLGNVIGDIMAVVVRVNKMDAQPVKKAGRKAA